MKRLLTTFAGLLMTLPLAAQTTSVVQDNVGNAEAMYYFHQRKVVRSSAGVLMVAWVDIRSAVSGGQVQYSIYDPGFQIWSPPAALSSAAYNARQPALAADNNGNIHAVWMQKNAGPDKYQLYYSKYNGSSWTGPIQISVAASVRAEEGTIEIATDGTIWVVYNNDGEGTGSEYLYVVKSTDGGTTWSTSADIISSGGAFGSSIEVGRTQLAPGLNGKMVACWDNSLTGLDSRREVFMNLYDGSSWGGQMRISDTTSVDRDHSRYIAVAVDGSDDIYVFYTLPIVSGSDPRLSRLVLHKNAWADPWDSTYTLAIDSSTVNYLSVSAVADENDVIHLAYRRDVAADTLYDLDEIVYRSSTDGGATWSDPTVVSRPNHDGGYVSIANRIDPTHGVDIAWRESRDENVGNQDTLAVVYANVPYTISSVQDKTPASFEIYSNYPNPFNPSTTIEFTLSTRDQIRLSIFDLTGREVKTIVNENRDAGFYRELWDGTNNLNEPVSSGVYFSRLSTGNELRTIKMILLK